ncbi:MAG: hypothetical protein ACRDPE_22550 [Solirubrobacterales bacterium]
MTRLRKKLTLIHAVASVTLFIALAEGTAYAATPETSRGDVRAGAPGDVYYAHNRDFRKSQSSIGVDVPAGDYVVSASMNTSLDRGFSEVECHLRSHVEDRPVDDRDGLLFLTMPEPPAPGARTFALAHSEAAFVLGEEGGRITFHCRAASGTATDVVFARPSITATRVLNVTTP